MINPDVLVKVKFYTTNDGGRSGPTPDNFFGCFFSLNNKNYDGRLLLEGIGPINPGDEKKLVPLAFLCPENIKDILKIGTKLLVHDGQCIGEATVSKIF
jgi:hypothetical protein